MQELKSVQPKKLGAVKPAPNIITVNGISYKLTDFENELTLKQYKIASPIAKKIIETVYVGTDLTKLMDNDLSESMSVLSKSMVLNDDLFDLISVIYINSDEDKFDPATYEERKNNLGDLTLTEFEKVKVAVSNFLDILLPSVIKDTQIILTTIQKIA